MSNAARQLLPSKRFPDTVAPGPRLRVLRASSRRRMAVVLLPILIVAAGCGGRTRDGEPQAADRQGGTPVLDGTGRKVRLPARPERIISLAPDVTELLFLLGLEDRIIGVTVHCDWPDQVRRKRRIGTLLNPNYELILSLRPDLVIASTAGNDQAAVLKLARLGVPVFVTAPRSVEKIIETVETVGLITETADRGRQLAADMRTRISGLQRRLAGLRPVRAFFITWFEPLLAPGRDTFETGVLELAGVELISATAPGFYPRYSLEQVIASDPDAVMAVYHSGQPLPDLRQVSGWKSLRAVRENRVFILNEVLQHPSPRFLDGLEEMARRLHPERFQ